MEQNIPSELSNIVLMKIIKKKKMEKKCCRSIVLEKCLNIRK